MRTSKTKVVYLLIIAMICMLLSACNGGSNSSATTSEETNSSSSESTESTGEETSDVPEINLVTWKSDVTDLINPHADEVMDLYGIKVVATTIPINDYINKVKADFTAGSPPDLIELQVGAEYAEMMDLMQDLTPYAESYWGEGWESKFDEASFEELKTFGEIKALPCGRVSLTYVGYNIDMFDQYGLVPPETYDDWVEISQTLRENGVAPFLHYIGDVRTTINMIAGICNDYAPGKFMGAEEGKYDWTDPDLVQGFTMWKQMIDDGVFCDGLLQGSLYPECYDMFANQQGAMFNTGSWFLQHMLAGFDFKAGMFQLPDFNGDGKKAPISSSFDVALCMAQGIENPEAAFKVMEYVSTGKMPERHALELFNTIPTATNITVDIENSPVIQSAPYSDVFKETVEMVFSTTEQSIGRDQMYIPEIRQAVLDALSAISTGQKTVEDALQEVDAVTKAYYQ